MLCSALLFIGCVTGPFPAEERKIKGINVPVSPLRTWPRASRGRQVSSRAAPRGWRFLFGGIGGTGEPPQNPGVRDLFLSLHSASSLSPSLSSIQKYLIGVISDMYSIHTKCIFGFFSPFKYFNISKKINDRFPSHCPPLFSLFFSIQFLTVGWSF